MSADLRASMRSSLQFVAVATFVLGLGAAMDGVSTWLPLGFALAGLVCGLASTFLDDQPRQASRDLRALADRLPGARLRQRDDAHLLDARRDGAFVRVTSTPGDRTLSCRVAHRVAPHLVGRVGRVDGDLLFVRPGETILRALPAPFLHPDAAAALDALLEASPSVRVGETDLEVHVEGGRLDGVIAALDRLTALARALTPPVHVRAASSRARVTCPYCHGGLDEGERVECAACATPHHAECFEEHGGCTTLGCESDRPTRTRRQAPDLGPLRDQG